MVCVLRNCASSVLCSTSINFVHRTHLIYIKGALLLSVGRRCGRQKSSCLPQNLVDGGRSRRADTRGLNELLFFQQLQNRVQRSERYVRCFGQYGGLFPRLVGLHPSFVRSACRTALWRALSSGIGFMFCLTGALFGGFGRCDRPFAGSVVFSSLHSDRAREASRKSAITSRNWGLRGSLRTTANVPSSNVTVVNGLPLLLIAASFSAANVTPVDRVPVKRIKKNFLTKVNVLKRVTASRPPYSKMYSAGGKAEATMCLKGMQ